MANKPWDMIVAEVEALELPTLVNEAWDWFYREQFVSQGHQDIIRQDLQAATTALNSDAPAEVNPLALQQVRGWCAQKRCEYGGLSPYELA